MDAARLASPVGDGILWHPTSLQDIYDVPSRTLLLFDFYRLGDDLAAAAVDVVEGQGQAGHRAPVHDRLAWRAH